MKTLYHGSIADFNTIDLSAGKGYKDFGKGFYATAVPNHADRLAIRNKRIAEKRMQFLKKKYNTQLEGVIAYRYELSFNENMEGLKVKTFESADSEWLRFIMNNRKCDDCAHDYDIVIGPTADAETTTIINEFYDELEASDYSDEICAQVIGELKPENLPKQYFFRTPEAIKTLKLELSKRQVIG